MVGRSTQEDNKFLIKENDKLLHSGRWQTAPLKKAVSCSTREDDKLLIQEDGKMFHPGIR
jgi:hypothetical protein